MSLKESDSARRDDCRVAFFIDFDTFLYRGNSLPASLELQVSKF